MSDDTNNTSVERKSISDALKNPTTLSISLLLLLLILVILIGNFIIVYTICVTKRLRVPTFYFVASLAVADFLVGFYVVPVALVFQVAIEMSEWSILSESVCIHWVFANIWFSSASILNLCFISWDRYLAITSPLRYSVRMNKKIVRRFIIFGWVASFCMSVITWFAVKYSDKRVHLCSLAGMKLGYAVTMFCMLFGLPVIFLAFTNGKILVIAKRQLKMIKSQSNFNLNQDENEMRDLTKRRPSTLQRTLESLRFRMEIRTFKLFLIVIGVFVFCWLPFFVNLLISSIRPIELPSNVKIIFVALTYINSACNVFIYGFLNKDFRKAIFMSRARPRSHSISSSSPGRGTLESELGTSNTGFSLQR